MTKRNQKSVNLICCTSGGGGTVLYARLKLTPKIASSLLQSVRAVYHSEIAELPNFYGVVLFSDLCEWGNADLSDLPDLEVGVWYSVDDSIEIDKPNSLIATPTMTIKRGEILFNAYDRHPDLAQGEYESALLSMADIMRIAEAKTFPPDFFKNSEIEDL